MTKNSFLRLVLRLGLRLVRRFAPGSLGLVLLGGTCRIMTFRFLRPNGHLIVVEPMLLTTAAAATLSLEAIGTRRLGPLDLVVIRQSEKDL